MNGLSVTAASVHYGTTVAVDRVSLTVAPGEVVALVGPSGCGKSTLLRAVAGLEPLVAGSIEWSGVDLAQVPVHRRGFGLMFQDGQLFAHQTVSQNVAFGLRMAKVGLEQRKQRAAEWLELVGLAGYGDRSVATLSGGQAQRVALARALAPSPRMILLDEPLSALDLEIRTNLRSELRRLIKAAGTPALWVTHDPAESAAADRVLTMSNGRLVAV